jgi:predicted small integral membrane protein
MPNDSRPFVREFLYKVIEDTQGTIRSLDAKAAVGVVILGAMLGRILGRKQFDAIWQAGAIPIAVFFVFAVAAILAAALAFKTVFPMVNPTENVTFANDLRPPFFIHRLEIRRWRRLLFSGKKFARLGETHESYCAAVDKATDGVIEKILAAEVLKLSFIRQVKHDRLTAFAMALTFAVLAFVALVFSVVCC